MGPAQHLGQDLIEDLRVPDRLSTETRRTLADRLHPLGPPFGIVGVEFVCEGEEPEPVSMVPGLLAVQEAPHHPRTRLGPGPGAREANREEAGCPG